MSALMAVGVAASIYSGISSSNSAKKERALEQQEWQANQALATQETQREQPFQQAISNQVGVLQSQALTPEAQMAQDRFKADTSRTEQQIREAAPTTGAGVAGGRMLTAQFGQAQGIAGIGLQDAVNKRAALGGWVDKGMQVPGGVKMASGANADEANSQANWAKADMSAATSDYGQAAAGLYNLAKLYKSQPSPKQGPTEV